MITGVTCATLLGVVDDRSARGPYRAVLADGEFRAVFLAGGLSVVGDQLARIAVALLVFERSGSTLAASATYALSYLTWLLGGPLLSVLPDRYSRRQVLVLTDLVRAALVLALVVPGLPLWVVFVLLAMVGLLSPPFEAARSALLADVLEGERYLVGNTLTQTVGQLGQVVGFAAGGALVAAIGVDGALLANAVTFALSALLILRNVRNRPAQPRDGSTRGLLREAAAGARLVAGTPVLRRYLAWGLLSAGVVIAPEGLAVAVAQDRGGGALAAGLLTASVPLGFLVASFAVLRVPAERRERLFLPMTLLSVVPLLLTPVFDSVLLIGALWAVAGLGNALQLTANASYVQAVPAHLRGRAYGIAGTALMLVQGLVLLLAGGLAEKLDARVPVAVMAGVGLLLLPLVASLHREPAQGRSTLRREVQG